MRELLEPVTNPTLITDRRACARRINRQNVGMRDLPGKGRGVVALRDFLAGETVVIGIAERPLPRRTPLSVQVDRDRHVLIEEPAVRINHACAPNTVVTPNEFEAYDFLALRDIAYGEEITFDYGTTELETVADFACLCGATACRGRPGGYPLIPEDNPLRAAGLVAPYLAALYPR